jgi:hypothetical protein
VVNDANVNNVCHVFGYNDVPAVVNFIYRIVPNLDVADVVEGAIYDILYIVTAVAVDIDIVPQYLVVVIMLMFAMFVIF